MSQSLLHQVTYSDLNCSTLLRKGYESLNPFYIRSRIPTRVGLCHTSGERMSQSLLHQVTYSDFCLSEFSEQVRLVSQSLLHQVTYSDKDFLRFCVQAACLNPFYIRSRIPTFPRPFHRVRGFCLNPFYIRSRIPTIYNNSETRRKAECLNPFYIRSRIPTHRSWTLWSPGTRHVSIPFTSGHVFRQ